MHRVTYKYRKTKNPIAKELRTSGKYKSKTIPDKRDKLKEKDLWKELMENLKSRR
jgi:hypothetical protein